VTVPAAALADQLPPWATLIRAPNPGPMTLDGTNTWVLRAPGEDDAVVVDPGPLDEGHLRAVADEACRNRPKPASSAEHRPVRLVITTHGHSDHVEGVARFRELCPDAEVVARSDGLELTIAGLRIRLVATPGHTSDSYCLLVSSADGDHPAVLTGDTILGRGTTVVAWPDGNLSAYLASLRGLVDLSLAAQTDPRAPAGTAGSGSVPVLPGHGRPLADCAAAARFYLAHRQARLDQVRAALAQGARTPGDVVATVYRDVDRALWPAAELSVRAQLDYLGQEADMGVGETVEGGPSRESSSGPVGLDTP
jgi:glyoxylase-like metal-dependent hydrolase (beta-lactamase superfamily II)